MMNVTVNVLKSSFGERDMMDDRRTYPEVRNEESEF